MLTGFVSWSLLNLIYSYKEAKSKIPWGIFLKIAFGENSATRLSGSWPDLSDPRFFTRFFIACPGSFGVSNHLINSNYEN